MQNKEQCVWNDFFPLSSSFLEKLLELFFFQLCSFFKRGTHFSFFLKSKDITMIMTNKELRNSGLFFPLYPTPPKNVVALKPTEKCPRMFFVASPVPPAKFEKAIQNEN